MLKISPRASMPACAGYKCPEATTCLRYLRPAVDQTVFDHATGRYPVQIWASYDIERLLFNDCDARIPIRQGMRQLTGGRDMTKTTKIGSLL